MLYGEKNLKFQCFMKKIDKVEVLTKRINVVHLEKKSSLKIVYNGIQKKKSYKKNGKDWAIQELTDWVKSQSEDDVVLVFKEKVDNVNEQRQKNSREYYNEQDSYY